MRRFPLLLACLSLVALGAGCTTTTRSPRIPHTDFIYPNSNVMALSASPVTADASTVCGVLIFPIGGLDTDDMKQLLDDAKGRAGADVLLNANIETSTFMIPYLFTLCSMEVSGYPAKMEVGRQELR